MEWWNLKKQIIVEDFILVTNQNSYLFFACNDGLDIRKEKIKEKSHYIDQCADYHWKTYQMHWEKHQIISLPKESLLFKWNHFKIYFLI